MKEQIKVYMWSYFEIEELLKKKLDLSSRKAEYIENVNLKGWKAATEEQCKSMETKDREVNP